MGPARTLLRFVFLSAISHQITYTLVEGSIFEGARRRAGAIHPTLGKLVRCHLCMGTWVGVLLAAAYRPGLLGDVQTPRPPAARRLLDFAGDAFLLALGARVWNEILGWLRREVQVKETEIAAEVRDRDRRGIADLGRSAYPGISVR